MGYFNGPLLPIWAVLKVKWAVPNWNLGRKKFILFSTEYSISNIKRLYEIVQLQKELKFRLIRSIESTNEDKKCAVSFC